MKKYFNSTDAKNLINNYGFALFPVHGIMPDGQCTCGNHSCTNKGKHPATKNGFEDATKDIKQLADLWAKRSNLNVGIATGALSGVFVIDIDSDAGEVALNALGAIPVTLTATTGKGKHLFFKYPDSPVITKRGIITNVDVRGDGGYVVGAGSNHASGAYYDFVNPLEVIADAPEFILDMVVKARIRTEPKVQLQLDAPKSSLQLTGWTQDDVRQHLAHINPDCGYDEWIAVGMALKSENHGFHLWDEWSSGGIKYDPNNMRSHWKSFQGSGVSYGTVVHMAKQGGWKPEARVVQQVRSVYTAQQQEERFDPETGEIIESEKKNSLYYINAPDITFSTSVTDFVKNTLTDGGLSVVYGESNCGKTFFMTDMAFHIVLGKEWHGKRVKQGNVLYVSMEGSYGLKNRIAAYKKQNNTDLSGFLMMPCSVDFINPEGNISEFVTVLADAKEKLGNIRLVVVDTLARAIGGGDENSGQDMGLLVKHADMIREYTGAHVCFIHHSGKDKARGARGHSSLRAAVDTEIEISRAESADFSNIKIAKQRDIEIAPDSQFKLKRVVLGMNDENEEITSCVVEPYSAKDDLDNVIENKFKNNKIRLAYDALIECIDKFGVVKQSKELPSVRVVSEEQFKDILSARGLLSENPNSARAQSSRYRIELIENKLAAARDGFIWSTRIT